MIIVWGFTFILYVFLMIIVDSVGVYRDLIGLLDDNSEGVYRDLIGILDDNSVGVSHYLTGILDDNSVGCSMIPWTN